MSDDAAIWRAQLADMPLEAICAYLRERGWVLRPAATHGPSPPVAAQLTTTALRLDLDRLPPGEPPLADADLPFDDTGRG